MVRQNKKVIDKETDSIIKDGEALRVLCKSAGWQIVRRRFINKIGELLNINSTDILSADASSIVQIIGAKKTSADILTKFLKDIDGTVEQHEGNKAMMTSIEEMMQYKNTAVLKRYEKE